MNHTIDTILNHRSIRKFTEDKLTDEQIHILIKAAQQASTSSNVMAYTIIGVTDPVLKKELRKISGQPYVEHNGHLFVFCGDLHRITQLSTPEERIEMEETIESTEQFIVTIIDAALSAQNLAIAAESIGLGICYLGSLRNDIYHVSELLGLPDYVVPLFGMAVGTPAQQPELKPRLPFEVVYHENKYLADEIQQPAISSYDAELLEYYQTRSSNTKVDTWSEQMIRKYRNPIRMDVSSFVKEQKLNKR
ncbi:oxygen-insensitive NADPH nitroreductase [Oceanobacillus chungangensis]|uniref:Oxygen-insensitive NADPH nitroreductase n=1 Tax=Oceanobacillus chungangensis TaxID=1229152 RepID=A0A3D8PQL3_9BACI|nr:oxygen-insensitive NADPH nitroreductase [Oceanobacillus chungangensis]RDW17992.1 oxygen-insensitive NADPH nitroreductase [Oceanobacillus chungangensis]